MPLGHNTDRELVMLWLIRFIVLEFGFQLGCLIHTYIVELAICIHSLTCTGLSGNDCCVS